MKQHPPSLWMDQIDDSPPRAGLGGDSEADVAIVGAGFTGLWTAYHLQRLSPTARIVILEANRVGFGASGRNGGWCMADVAVDRHRWDGLSGGDGTQRMDAAMQETVDLIERTITDEAIECDWARGGTLTLARNAAQVRRLQAEPRLGSVWLNPDEARAMCNATKVMGGLHTPADAVLQPAKLVTELAERCERLGIVIHEDTRVQSVEQGLVTTEKGRVKVASIVLATEAYSSDMAGRQRDLVPLYSRMIATEPLPAEVLDEIGMVTRPGFGDARYRVIYGQRTADGRIAFGATSSSYRFRSRIDVNSEQNDRAHGFTEAALHDLFPVLEGRTITHRWGGVLGVPRNWLPTVTVDRSTGIHRAGGYVGEGVAAAHLAGRCLAHSIVDDGHPVTTLPWVRRVSRKWPIEPFRWVGINAGSGLFRLADRRESATGRTAHEAAVVWKFLRR